MTTKLNPGSRYLSYLLPALVLAIVCYIRIRLLSVPLERDEGEYAYMGQLLLKGIAPFTHAYTMKLPGVSLAYAFFMLLFGQTPVAIHSGLLIVNAIGIYLVYLIAKRLFDSNSAVTSAVSYAVLSLSGSVNGLFAHATHFVVLFALAGFLLLLRFVEDRRIPVLFASGLCFGLAITMKQHAILLFLFAALYLTRDAWKKRSLDSKTCLAGSLFLLGSALPYGLIVLWMLVAGSFSAFWFWTVQYAREYVKTPPLADGWFSFTYHFKDIAACQFPLWILAACGAVLLCCTPKSCRTDRFFLFGFLLFSFLAICPGLYFTGHYFVLLLPALALLIGAVAGSARSLAASDRGKRLCTSLVPLLVLAAIAYSLYQEKSSYFTLSPVQVSRAAYESNPFPEAVEIARYLKDNTTKDDEIAVLGSEPEIYFYADRLSATAHIYMYGLMEKQPYAERMQIQMIRQIESARPKYIVMTHVATSWLAQASSVQSIFTWGTLYVRNFYREVGLIDILDPSTTRYIWGDQAGTMTPVSETYLVVYQRKGNI